MISSCSVKIRDFQQQFNIFVFSLLISEGYTVTINSKRSDFTAQSVSLKVDKCFFWLWLWDKNMYILAELSETVLHSRTETELGATEQIFNGSVKSFFIHVSVSKCPCLDQCKAFVCCPFVVRYCYAFRWQHVTFCKLCLHCESKYFLCTIQVFKSHRSLCRFLFLGLSQCRNCLLDSQRVQTSILEQLSYYHTSHASQMCLWHKAESLCEVVMKVKQVSCS